MNRKDAKNAKNLWQIDGGNAGDLTIACRWEAGLLRTRAFVAAMLPTGRRARGASVPPYFHGKRRPITPTMN